MMPSIKKENKKKNIKRIALYVIYDKDGILDKFRKYYITELRKVTDCIIAVVCGTLTPESRDELDTIVDEICIRENKGLLAGAWIDGIKYIGWDRLDDYDELLMLNDSFFGPFYPLEDMFTKMEESNADFYGAFKNYEEKTYTNIAGRALKHGYFRGSICYFYIIKNRLLHSPEFKKYWSQLPDIREDWDTYFFAEMDFYDYVRDAGFRIDAYQSDKLKGYFFDNLTHNMEKLIKNDKIPFARIRPFCTDTKIQSTGFSYSDDPRRTLDYIKKHTNYDTNMIWDYILRTKNLTAIWQQLQLEYVVSKNVVESKFVYNKAIAVILHIYYDDLVEEMANYCENFTDNTKFFITTIKDSTKEKIENEFSKRNLNYICKLRPNVGVAMSTLWITYADVVLDGNYEYICYFHDKKSPYQNFLIQGALFAKRCYENLFGNKEIVKNIINIFEDNPRLGVLGAPMPYHGDYFAVAYRSWDGNYENTKKLSELLKLKVNIDPNIMPVTPYGDMFWFRANALKKVIEHRFTYNDFDIEYKQDFTLLHAIERIYAFAAQDSGYYYAEVINSDEARSDLVNYQYMLYGLLSTLLKNNQRPTNYTMMQYVIDYHTQESNIYPSTTYNSTNSLESQISGTPRIIVKNAIKKRVPSLIWKIMRKIYHICGGKKWRG